MSNRPQQFESAREKIGELVSIYLRGRQWWAGFQIDGIQHRQSMRTSSKKEARRRARRLEVDILDGRYAKATKPKSIVDITLAYLSFLRTENRAHKTIQKCELVVRRLVERAELRGQKSIADVDLTFVDAYRAWRKEDNAAPKTILNETVIIRQIVNFALSRGMIERDPLKGLKIRKVKSRPQPCWSREQVEQILTTATPPHRIALTILADTGMRVGELKYLTWADVDFDHNVLHIRAKDNWQPKTGEDRSLPMSIRLRELFDSLPKKTRWVLTARESKEYPSGDHQISERRLLQYLKRVLKSLGLAGHLHTFRHSFISDALIRGVPAEIVRGWVGHLDPSVTRLYTHISDEASQAAMQRLTHAQQPPAERGTST